MNLQTQKFKLLTLIFVSFFLISSPFLASARGLVPCGGYNADGTRERVCNVEDIFVLVARVTNWLIAVAGIYAVYKIIQGGFWLIVSVGNEEKITQMKGQITDAIIGFVLVTMAFMFVNTVVNFMITRSFVTSKNPACRLDLTSPLTYLTINESQCNGQQDSKLYLPNQ